MTKLHNLPNQNAKLVPSQLGCSTIDGLSFEYLFAEVRNLGDLDRATAAGFGIDGAWFLVVLDEGEWVVVDTACDDWIHGTAVFAHDEFGAAATAARAEWENLELLLGDSSEIEPN